MITEKDRNQLLRMAGNIAGGLVTTCSIYETENIADKSVEIAYSILEKVNNLMTRQTDE